MGAIAARGHTGAAEYVGLLGRVGVGVGNLTIVVTGHCRDQVRLSSCLKIDSVWMVLWLSWALGTAWTFALSHGGLSLFCG